MPLRKLVVTLLLLVASAAALGADAEKLLAQLHQDFQPGLVLGRAQEILKARGATISTRTAAECDALAREGKLATPIPPQGGPCIFGKIPVGRRWYGAKRDVILQIVFGADGRLVDANFEEIESFL